MAERRTWVIGGLAGFYLRLAVILSPLLLPVQAQAHHRSAGSPDTGLAIPNLTHGQMTVIADNAAAILDLANRKTVTDPVFRRLQNFAALQRTYCLWSLMPGSLADEDSPFNECTHAYLAALRALLVHMQEMPGEGAAVDALVTKIEMEMLHRRSSLILCRYSGEAFNTAGLIIPHWREILSHPPSLLAFGGVVLIFVAGISTLFKPRPSPTVRYPG